MKIANVALGRIAVNPDRMRVLRKDKIAELAASMKERGLLQPIVLRTPPKGSGYVLVAGWHRFEAAKRLNWRSIPAVVYEGMGAIKAELAEIDENLIHVDLTPAERAAHERRRKQLHEQLHPETKKGGDRKSTKAKSSRQVGDLKSGRRVGEAKRYTATAAKAGRSERSVQRDVARGAAIPNVGALAGTSLDKGEELDALAKLPPDEQRALAERARAGEKVSAKTRVKQVRRAERERDLAASTAAAAVALGQEIPASVIVVDWALRFNVRSENGEDRSPENHYLCGTVEEMIALKPPMADNVLVFAWTSAPQLENSMAIMRAWGIQYKSYWGWDKEIEGTGYWGRSRLELILIGTNGNIPAPAPGEQFPQLFRSRRREHSRKPDEVYEAIERLYPNVVKLEMFARNPRPGWRTWGNEVSSPPSDQAPPEVTNELPAPTVAPDDTAATTERDDDDGIPPFLRRTREPVP